MICSPTTTTMKTMTMMILSNDSKLKWLFLADVVVAAAAAK
jgi:hypothetical protein